MSGWDWSRKEPPRRVSPPASQRVLVSSRGAFRSSTRFSSDPCESRTKATSDASLESRPRGLLGECSRPHRRTRKTVVRLLPYLTSEHGSQSLLIQKRKRNFTSLDI